MMSKDQKPSIHDTYSFQDADKLVDEFESFINSHGVYINRGSQLEILLLIINEVLLKHKMPSLQDKYSNIIPWLRDVMGMNNLILRILRVKNHSSIENIVPHLELLNSGNPIQNTRSPVTDQASNKLFELTVAAALMIHADSVTLENPNYSEGNNPDVIATFKNKSWGFACKVAHSLKGKTFFDNIEKGIDQIEKSPATAGVVVINLKNVINHDNYWTILNYDEWLNGAEPEFSAFKRETDARDLLLAEALSVSDLIHGAVEQNELIKIFSGKKSVPGWLYYLQTSVGIIKNGMPISSSFGFLNFHLLDNPKDSDAKILDLFNDGLQLNPRL